jgi:hypothetical protein
MSFRSTLLLCAVLLLSPTAFGQYTFPTFSATPVTTTWQAVNLTTLSGVTIPDGTYTNFSISLPWASTGNSSNQNDNAWSSEARVALSSTAGSGTGTNPTFATGNTLYRNTSNPTAGGASNANNTTLTFNYAFTTNYTVSGGVAPDLFLNLRQSFAPFTTQVVSWNNVAVTLTGPVGPPSSVLVTDPSNTTLNLTTASTIRWARFVYTSGASVTLDTLGTTQIEDTEIGVYRADGTFIASNDDINGSLNRLSSLTLTPAQLTVGQTYYVAVGQYNVTFGADSFAVSSTGEGDTLGPLTGDVYLNINAAPVPEPVLLGFAGFAIATVAARRRRN